MRSSDCCTRSREVTRPDRRAACMSGMLASTTVNGFLATAAIRMKALIMVRDDIFLPRPRKERSMKRVLAAAVAAVLISAVGYAQSDEEKIRARAQAFADAWNKHDTMGMAYLWSASGDLINP